MIVRDINETKKFTIEDAEFTIRVIPRKVFRKLGMKLAKGVSRIKGQGSDPFTPEKIREFVQSDEGLEAGEALIEAYSEYVRAGVAGHSGIKTAEGAEIPFEKAEDGTVSEKTLELYDHNGLINKLAVEILKFNTLSDTERKN